MEDTATLSRVKASASFCYHRNFHPTNTQKTLPQLTELNIQQTERLSYCTMNGSLSLVSVKSVLSIMY